MLLPTNPQDQLCDGYVAVRGGAPLGRKSENISMEGIGL